MLLELRIRAWVYPTQEPFCQGEIASAVNDFDKFCAWRTLQTKSIMKPMLLAAALVSLVQLEGCAQNGKKNVSTKKDNSNEVSRHVGGPCEGCEAIYESPIAFENLNQTDSLPDFAESGPKIRISGTVYRSDGKTPAKNVVIYVYHTDQTGHYTDRGDQKGWGKRHGYIRGWVKTDRNGFYEFYTLRPVSYPNSNIPQHIHVTVKEPDKNEYYIDEYLFEDDPFLTTSERNKQEKRGGDGIVKLILQSNGVAHATRDILLGKNIPAYPSN
jgi:protocatechuate 3,4-dioxygenase beta subunit